MLIFQSFEVHLLQKLIPWSGVLKKKKTKTKI